LDEESKQPRICRGNKLKKTPAKIRKIELTAEKKTLLITLLAKSQDYKSKNSILNDKKAFQIASRFVGLGHEKESSHNKITVVRARQLDEWVEDFIKEHKKCTVLNLGCGLDTRVTRIDPPSTVSWYDVDYPEVITLRSKFYSNAENYRMISSSIVEEKWLEEIPEDAPVMVVAEGVLEYLTESDVKKLLNRLTLKFRNGEIVFDVLSSAAIKMGKEELKKTMGAEHKWAVDDLSGVDKLNLKITRIDAISVFDTKYMRKIESKERAVYESAIEKDPKFREMARLLRYKF
jgi:O-methyltransferase involved in polyketide biosynthesis